MSGGTINPTTVAAEIINLIGQRAAGLTTGQTDHLADAVLEGTLQEMWNKAANPQSDTPPTGNPPKTT